MTILPHKKPLFITIGPPCAGKTTLLQLIEKRTNITTIHDVTLDDQQDVYVEIPVDYFLVNQPPLNNKTKDPLLQRRIQNKSLERRIYDNATNGELRAILQRFDGRLSSNEFSTMIHALYAQHANDTSTNKMNTTDYYSDIATLVIDTIENIMQSQDAPIALPLHIQLFCVESLFRPHPDTNKTGIETAHNELVEHSMLNTTTTAVAWGNTNTRPRDYRQAFEIASNTSRPVYFILYTNTTSSSGGHLPNIGVKKLYKRNVKRMLQTGKFVPCRQIVESSSRIERLLETAVKSVQRQCNATNITKLQLDQELAKMVNFEMYENRTVRQMPRAAKKRVKQTRRQRRRPQSAKATTAANHKSI